MSEPTLPASGSEPGDTEDGHGQTVVQTVGKDPSNTDVDELVAPLAPDDDVHERVQAVDTAEDDGGAGH